MASGRWLCAILALACLVRIVAGNDNVINMETMPTDEQVKVLERRAQTEAGRGHVDNAEMLLRKAIELKPNDPYLHLSLAMIFAQAGQLGRSLALFERAIFLNPPNVHQIHYNLAYTYQNMGRYHDALAEFQRVIKIDPTFRPGYIKGAYVAKEIGNIDVAVGLLRGALRLQPNDPAALMYLADTLNNRKRWDEAIDLYQRAIKLDKRNPELRLHIGDTLTNLGRTDEAMYQYRRGLRYNPTQPELLAAVVQSMQTTSTWRAWDRYLQRALSAVTRSLEQGVPSPLSPYHAMFLPLPRQLRKAIARSWSAATAEQTLRVIAQGDHTPTVRKRSFKALRDNKLRVGYLSRRFERYPGTQLMLRLFGGHDRSAFEVWCYAAGPDDHSEERATVARDCDVFQDVSLMAAGQTAATIAKDRIHVLIDYDGLHQFNSLNTLSLRPAPVQVTFLGFAGTTGGGNTLDHIVVDPHIAPLDRGASEFGEKVLMLPVTYQPQDPNMAISLPPSPSVEGVDGVAADDGLEASPVGSHEWRRLLRARLGLPSDAVVLACFNRNSKIDPVLWRVWMNVLRQVPAAVLWLLASKDHVQAALLAEAAAAGVSAARIFFAPRVSKEIHLGRHLAADLFLDTLHYDAHTTASDALYTGLPVLTLPGEAMASRVAAGLLNATGSPRVAAALTRRGLRDYERAAVRLAASAAGLGGLRAAVAAALPVDAAARAIQGGAAAPSTTAEARVGADGGVSGDRGSGGLGPPAAVLFRPQAYLGHMERGIHALWEAAAAHRHSVGAVADAAASSTAPLRRFDPWHVVVGSQPL